MVKHDTMPVHEERTEQAAPVCRHYWIIETPEGPTSRGTCKFCGAVKEFYNSWAGLGSAWTRAGTAQRDRPRQPSEAEPEENEGLAPVIDADDELDD